MLLRGVQTALKAYLKTKLTDICAWISQRWNGRILTMRTIGTLQAISYVTLVSSHQMLFMTTVDFAKLMDKQAVILKFWDRLVWVKDMTSQKIIVLESLTSCTQILSAWPVFVNLKTKQILQSPGLVVKWTLPALPQLERYTVKRADSYQVTSTHISAVWCNSSRCASLLFALKTKMISLACVKYATGSKKRSVGKVSLAMLSISWKAFQLIH